MTLRDVCQSRCTGPTVLISLAKKDIELPVGRAICTEMDKDYPESFE